MKGCVAKQAKQQDNREDIMAFKKSDRRQRIRYQVRKKVKGTAERPRLCVFRSNNEIYCQLIDDINGNTLAAARSSDASIPSDVKRVEQAKHVGNLIASKAQDIGITSVVFDRAGYLYHGRVKALAEGAREKGLKF